MKSINFIRKIIATTAFMLCLSVGAALAQRVVTGVIYDTDGKTPMSGASVILKGSSNVGTVADVDGKYSIKVPNNSTLVYKFIGYKDQEVPVGTRSVINVTLTTEATQVDEVVVTAMGLTREQKSIGYAVTKIDNESLTGTVQSNWLGAMSGKVAGLDMQSAGTGPMGSMRVVLRGENSLNFGNNEALFVVDGVPINSSTTASGSGTNYANSDASVDFGNGASDINPDDIENISVLKGPAATALYGSRAANGAIVITTKSGRQTKGIGVTINSSVSFEKAGYWPDFQNQYGPSTDAINDYCFWNVPADKAADGIAANRNSYNRYAFGEKFDPNKLRYLYTSRDWDNDIYTKQPFVYADNWYTGLFKTGVTYKNNIAVDGSNGKGFNGRISYTDTRADWILPNSKSVDQVFAVSMQQELNKYITLSAKANYYHKFSDNVPISGYDPSNVMYQLVWGYNVNDIKKTWKSEYDNGRFNATNLADGSLVYPTTSDSYNPYRTLYDETNTIDKDRMISNAKMTIKLLKGLELDLKGTVDITNEFRTRRRPKFTNGYLNGYYKEQTLRTYEYNLDFMFRYTNNTLFDGRLGINANFGGTQYIYKYANTVGEIKALLQDRWYSLKNATEDYPATISQTRRSKRINSLFGLLSLSWNDTFFVDITGRNDWSSTLHPDNCSYFYPSVSGSILLNKLFNFNKNVPFINFAKLRASWANVGNDTSPYNLYDAYSISGYTGGYTLPGSMKNAKIKPENVESWEVGLETKMFHNRVGFDIAWYRNSATNQIVSVSTDQIVGATSRTINVGEIQNTGIEIALSLTPVKTKDFTWNMNINWSKNKNKLVSLTDDWDPTVPLQLSNGTTIGSRTYIYSYIGEEMYNIYGRDYNRAPEGSFYIDAGGNKIDCSGAKLIDASSGLPSLTTSPDQRIAKVNPNWKAGMTQMFRYKNFSLGMTFAWQCGGHSYSVTNFSLSYIGKLKNSLEGRNDGMVIDGVVASTNASGETVYTPNNKIVTDVQNYYTNIKWIRNNTRENTFSTSFVKLKEVRFDYQVPEFICKKLKIIQGASLGVFATNLFCITDFPQYDPETGLLSGTNIMRGIETMTFPMTRSYGVNVKLQF